MNSSRVLKFRAWNHADKKMLYDFFIASDGPAFVVRDPNTLAGDYVEVIPDIENVSVEQFTGLLDKNGREIFEYDIVQWKWPDGDKGKPGPVTFDTIYEGDDKERTGWVCIDCFVDSEVEVVGNIHSTPELLEDT